MAGIYLHIPFCKKACHYCNFHFSTSLHRKSELVQSMISEITNMLVPEDVLLERRLGTIYFGGGTPSLLTGAELAGIVEAIHHRFDVEAEAEITLEANPDNISSTNIALWKQMGINRLSIGIQSFFDEDLLWMNRAHSAAEAMESILTAQAAGISNISIDLIYGTPGLTHPRWQKNLEQAIALSIPHISSYALTVEENTALHHFIKKGKTQAPEESVQASQFELLTQTLVAAGYEHYEISNFARPGMRSRHNSAYWLGIPYYGIGPSAHSFDGLRTRWWNVANNALYIQQALSGAVHWEVEQLTQTQRLNEKIMTGLRRVEGIITDVSKTVVEGQPLTQKQWENFEKSALAMVNEGLIQWQAGRITLTAKGRFLADGIAAGLFADDESSSEKKQETGFRDA